MQTQLAEINIDNLDKHLYLDKNLVKWFVKRSIEKLEDYSVGEENLLISLATGLSYTQIILFKDFDKPLLKKIKRFLKLRVEYMPLNKIAKKAFFYKDEFYINNYVLAPRKETELIVEAVLKYISVSALNQCKVLDLCCGSGAIGLSVAKYSPSCKVVLADISKSALKVTDKNLTRLKLKGDIELIQSDMFGGLKSQNKFDIIVSNPPYIKSSDIPKLDVGVKRYDPRLALDGGADGLKFYKEIAKRAKDFLNPHGCIFLEIGYNQAQDVKKMLTDGFNVDCFKDYSGNDRLVIARLK